MPDRYSTGKKQNTLSWSGAVIDWPYEIVVAQAEVIALQLPNLFEWAVVRILADFEEGNRPSLSQAAEELDIKDPVFLSEALGRLIESGVIERIDAEGQVDFANCRLGSQINSQQQKSAPLPERHGVNFCFDAITGRHIVQRPADTTDKPQAPIVALSELPAKRTEIGLDRAREYAKGQDEPFLAAQSRMTGVQIDAAQGSFAWQPLEAVLAIDPGGTIRCELTSADPQQQQWIDDLDFKHELFENLFSTSANARQFGGLTPVVSYDKWIASVDKLIDPKSVGKDAASLIASAKQQILINAYWLSLAGIKKALKSALAKGIRCVIFGWARQLSEHTKAFGDSVEIIELNESPDTLHVVSIIADGSKAISLDKLQLRSPSKCQVEVIVASTLKSLAGLELQEELLGRMAEV